MVAIFFPRFIVFINFWLGFVMSKTYMIVCEGVIFIFHGHFLLLFLFQWILHFIWGPNHIIAFYVKLFNVEYPIIACERGIFIFLQSFSLIFLYRWILHVCLGFKTTLLPLSYFFSFQFSISDIRLHMS